MFMSFFRIRALASGTVLLSGMAVRSAVSIFGSLTAWRRADRGAAELGERRDEPAPRPAGDDINSRSKPCLDPALEHQVVRCAAIRV